MADTLRQDELGELRSFLGFLEKWARGGLNHIERRLLRLGLIERVGNRASNMYRLTIAGERACIKGVLSPPQGDAPEGKKT